MTEKTFRLAAIQRQIKRIHERTQTLQQRSSQIAWLRLGIVLLGSALAFLAVSQVGWELFWAVVALTTIVFTLAARRHGSVKRTIAAYEAWMQVKRTHLARAALDWRGMPPPEFTHTPQEHPFAADLDLPGEYGLHRLLDTTSTHEGSARLWDWLLTATPDTAAIQQRQAQVSELLALPAFRDKLALRAALVTASKRQRSHKWEASAILRWLAGQQQTAALRPALLLMLGLAVVNAVLVVLDALNIAPALWAGSYTLYVLVYARQWQQVAALFDEALGLQDRLHKLYAIFSDLETRRYGDKPLLKNLCAPFLNPAERPSAALRRVGRVVAAAGIRNNPLVWFALNIALPWDVFIAHQLNRQKARLAQHMPAWLEAWFELEALSALATFAYLNPAYACPTVRAGALLTAKQIGHPLIPDAQRVNNDYAVEQLGAVTLITGSNMSGKSTFLRTLGVNLALAYAGAPVAAQQLETGLFRVFTTIRVSDSVTDGFSYFYAEVRRLKALLDALQAEHPLPLFFLIDEIFRGTNNRERLMGSRAYVRALAGGHGSGLISTHDLELVKLADELPQISNRHFREEVQDGRMIFDYHLRPGPCPTTNALRIMALAGLPVPAQEA